MMNSPRSLAPMAHAPGPRKGVPTLPFTSMFRSPKKSRDEERLVFPPSRADRSSLFQNYQSVGLPHHPLSRNFYNYI